MSIEVSNLDHLGLVAGIIDEIGIERKINELLGEQPPEKITGGQNVKWLCRVPFRIKAAHKLVQEMDSSSFIPSQIPGYSYQELMKTYGGIQQRWLVVDFQLRRESDLKNLEKKIKIEATETRKKLRTLTSQKFACILDARKAAQQLLKKSLYHKLTAIKVQQVEGLTDSDFSDQIPAQVILNNEKVEP